MSGLDAVRKQRHLRAMCEEGRAGGGSSVSDEGAGVTGVGWDRI